MDSPTPRGKLSRAFNQALDWAYDAALRGGPGFDSVEQLAASYAKRGGTPREQAESLVRWQVGKAGALGFAAGLPGLALMPATVPTNIATVMLLQLRMSTAVAVLGGYDPRDDQVRAFAIMCLAGDAAFEIVRDVGLKLGSQAAHKAVGHISGKTLSLVNRRVSARLASKLGSSGATLATKAVPIVGGLIGGAFDAVSTRVVGHAAIKAFIKDAPAAPDLPADARQD